MFQPCADEKDMLLLGMYNSPMLSTWKKGPKGKAERQNMVKDAKAAYTAAGCPPLGPPPRRWRPQYVVVLIPQLVGDERGTVFVPIYDWQAFLVPFFKAVNGIKQYHHFSFSHQAQGVVMATTHTEGSTQILPV